MQSTFEGFEVFQLSLFEWNIIGIRMSFIDPFVMPNKEFDSYWGWSKNKTEEKVASITNVQLKCTIRVHVYLNIIDIEKSVYTSLRTLFTL